MSAYTTWQSVTGKIPEPLAINALDDGTAGGTVAGVAPKFNQIVSDISLELDGYLASIYPVPWPPNGIPPAVAQACLYIVCQNIAARRLAQGQANPWAEDASKWKTIVEQYGKGDGNLGPNFPRSFSPGFGVIGEMAMDWNTA